MRLGYQSWQAFGVLLIIQIVVVALYCFNKAKRNAILRFEAVLVVVAWIYLIVVSKYRLSIGGYACLYLPYLVYCFLAYFGHDHKRNRSLILLLITSLHAILVGFSSNIGIRAVANIAIGAVAFGTLMLDCDDKYRSKANGLMVLSLLFFTVGFKAYYGYCEPNVMAQDQYIEQGPLQGLYTDETFYAHYQTTYRQIQTIDANEDVTDVILITDESRPFLALTKPIHNYSTYIYLCTKQDYLNEMEEYLTLHPARDLHVYIFSNRFDITPKDLSFVTTDQISVMD